MAGKKFINGTTYVQTQGAFWADLLEKVRGGANRVQTKAMKYEVADRARLIFLGMKRVIARSDGGYDDARALLNVKCSMQSYYSAGMERYCVLVFSTGQPARETRKRIVDEVLMGESEDTAALPGVMVEEAEATIPFDYLEEDEIRALTLTQALDYFTSMPDAFCGYPLPEDRDDKWVKREQLRHDVDCCPASSLVMKLKVRGVKPGTEEYTDIFSNPSTDKEWFTWAIRHTWIHAICQAIGKVCYVPPLPVIRNERGIEISVSEYVDLGLIKGDEE